MVNSFYNKRLLEYEMLAIGMALTGREEKLIDSGIVGDMFNDERCGKLFDAIFQTVMDGTSPNIVTIKKYLPSNGDLIRFSVECSQIGYTSCNEEEIIKVIKKNAINRKLLNQLRLVLNDCEGIDPLNAECVLDKLNSIHPGNSDDTQTVWVSEAVKECIKDLSDRIEGKLKHGYSTGHKTLDGILAGGFCPGRVYTLAGRPGSGKTTLAINWIYESMKQGAIPCYYTIEMSEIDITNKLISLHGKISQNKIFDADEGEDFIDQYVTCAEELHKMKAAIAPKTDGKWNRLVTSLRLNVKNHGVSIAVIDYLQQFRLGSKLSLREEMDRIMHDVKNLAMELGIPIILISQLNRKIEERKDGPPVMSDLKECGTIEQASDAVIILNPLKKQDGKIYSVEAHLLKNRWGKTCHTYYQPDFDLNRFDVAPIDQ